MIEDINRDPWGMAYKIVLKKLKGLATTLSEKMRTDELNETLDRLFPKGRELMMIERDTGPWNEEMDILPGEVREAIKGKKAKVRQDRTGSTSRCGKALQKKWYKKLRPALRSALKKERFPKAGRRPKWS